MTSASEFLSQLLTAPGAGPMGFLQILGAIAIAYFGGILSSLTPCVYPMIPITVSVVSGMGPARHPWREALIRGAAYVVGMAFVYSILGVLAGLTGKVFGSFTHRPGWYLGLGVVMTLAALMMVDVLPFDPAALWNRVQARLSGRGGKHHPPAPLHEREMTRWGALFLGASSGFIAAPCTTPVLTSILAYIANSQSVFLGLVLMIAFSFGLGTLLVIIAAFTGALQVLPRSGQWMKTLKTAGGLILLFFAQYLIYQAGLLGGL